MARAPDHEKPAALQSGNEARWGKLLETLILPGGFMTTKESLADWWRRKNSPPEEPAETGGFNDSIEALYAKLNTQPAVETSIEILRKEMGAVYRDMRAGRIDYDDGARLAYVLDLLRKSHESTMVRNKLGAMEKALGVRPDSGPGWLGLPSDEESS